MNDKFDLQPVALKAGECLAPACDRARELYVIRKGWAASACHLEDGRRHIGGLHLPGELCDARWTHGPIIQPVVALTDLEVDAIDVRRLTDILRRSAKLNELLWMDATATSARAVVWETCLAKRSALERVCHLLCEVALRCSRTLSYPKGTCDWLLQDGDVADFCGLTRLHAKRQIQLLQRLGLARIRQKKLFIGDFERLANVAHFDVARFRLQPAFDWTLSQLLQLHPA